MIYCFLVAYVSSLCLAENCIYIYMLEITFTSPKQPAKVLTAWMHSAKVPTMEWLSQSPHLNPKPHLQGVLKMSVGAHRYQYKGNREKKCRNHGKASLMKFVLSFFLLCLRGEEKKLRLNNLYFPEVLWKTNLISQKRCNLLARNRV